MPASAAIDRQESLKAGLTAAVITVISGTVWWLGSMFLRADSTVAVWRDGAGLWHIAVAGLTGFLFGVTYRYAVRQDPNRQLQMGTVMAFTLVRGLATAESVFDPTLPLGALIGHLGLPVVESGLMLGAAAIGLQEALDRGWIQAVPSVCIDGSNDGGKLEISQNDPNKS